MKINLFFYCLTGFLTVACATTSHKQQLNDKEALVVAAFHEFYGLESEPWQELVAQTHGLPSPGKPITHYYITVLDKDPSPLLLKHLVTTKASFHMGSEFKEGKGICFSVTKITTFDWLGRGVVEFSHYGGPLCGYGGKYYFRKHNGVWKFVKKATPAFIA